jgi:pimeloyl-ACP methyl ester carboxylesterase
VPPTRATTPDGIRLALHDLGGDGTPALFVHATGFHGRVFAPLARRLWDRFHCLALDLRGHGESGVPANLNFDWVGFGTDVLTAIDELGLERPAGIGHSCGGAALLLAEQARPGTFTGLYCFEPVVRPPDDPPPAEISSLLIRAARQRREVFSSRQLAYDNYASKLPLRVLDPEALAAYVDFGFEDLPDGSVRLRCRGENEALVYEGAVRHFSPEMLGSVAEHLSNGRLEVLPGLGHFGPLERPGVVAASVIRAVDAPRA